MILAIAAATATFIGWAIAAFVASQLIGTAADTYSTHKKIGSQKKIADINAKIAEKATKLRKELQEKMQAQAAEDKEEAMGQIEGMRKSASRQQSQQSRQQRAMATNPGSFMPAGAEYDRPPQQAPYGGGGVSPMAAMMAAGGPPSGGLGPQFAGAAGQANPFGAPGAEGQAGVQGQAGGAESLEAMLAGVSPEYAQEVLAGAAGRPDTMAGGLRGQGIDLAELFPDVANQDGFA